MIREYHESAIVWEDGPFAARMIKAKKALCPDGKRRNAYPSHDGIADTFFSIPAYVHVGNKRVYGYVTMETVNGFSVDMPDDPVTVKFVPYTYRKNHALVGG